MLGMLISMDISGEGSGDSKISRVTDYMIGKIGKGDGEAFEEFYKLTDSAIYGYALSLMKNTHDAKDIMQETYIKVRQNASKYVPRGKPMAWVFMISKNLSFMKMRGMKKEEITDEIDVHGRAESIEDNTLDNIVLKAALDILDSESRQIVLLHAVTGLKHREIAECLGMNQSTVLSRYSRSIKKLESHLKEM